ncbi:GNAT family N-acetyltransferase [Streptomyces griseoviridis]
MSWSSGPVLRTRRLVLEPIRREDSDDLFETVVSQDSVMRWLATGRADSRSAAEAMCADHVAHWARHGYGDFAVREAATRSFLGRVGLRNRPGHGVDLGFALHPRAQGRGIAGEAGRACLDLAFGRLGLPAVLAFVLPANAASIALLRRLGARADGTVQSSGLECLRYRFEPDATVRPDAPGSPGHLGDGGGLRLVRADDRHTLTAVSDGRPVASVEWLLRDMAFDGVPRRAAGLGEVRTHSAYRDRGLDRTMVSVAVEHARTGGAETVVLLPRPELVPFYVQMGWSRLSVPVTAEQPDGGRARSLDAMFYDLNGRTHPASAVDLRGLPF